MSCSTISKNPNGKKKMRLTSGIMIVIAGALLAISGIFMGVYIVRHYQDTYAIGLNYNNQRGPNQGGYSSASFFGRRRRDADDADDALNSKLSEIHETKLDAFLAACELAIKCDCDGDVECEAAMKKNVKAFQRGQAMVFGMGTFLGKLINLKTLRSLDAVVILSLFTMFDNRRLVLFILRPFIHIPIQPLLVVSFKCCQAV
jgi:hypothetical protein